MSHTITISPRGPLTGSIRPPGSKSLTNRALVCAALAEGHSQLSGVLCSDDTRVMIEGLRQLGVDVTHDVAREIVDIRGCAGQLPARSAELFVGNSGTTVRFLTAVAALGQGTFRLDGVPRMRARPIADLLDALNQLGADARSATGSGCPPVVVRASGLNGGAATIAGQISSQFLSAVLMAAPCALHPVNLTVDGPLVSQPYIKMTLAVMKAFGVPVAADADRFAVPRRTYRARPYVIEPDASAASYFWAAAAITDGHVTVQGLTRESLQGDVAFCDCLARMGCAVEEVKNGITVCRGTPLQGIDADMNAISDTVQTLAAVALFAKGPTVIRGVGHIRHKETDRIGDLARELRKLGAEVTETSDGMRIQPGTRKTARIATYHDHRMAMSLALVGLGGPPVEIEDPACTAKTYPNFFADLQSLATV